MGRRRRRKARATPVLLLLVALAALAAYAWWQQQGATLAPASTPPAPSGTLRVHYVDVGQGDGTIWELPDGSIVVYDCGPAAATPAENPMVRYLQDNLSRAPGSALHALVASHGHLDHVGGCEEVLATYRFAHVYEAWYDGDDRPASYRRFQDQLRAEGATIHTLGATPTLEGEVPFGPGDEILLPAASAARATLLWPSAFVGGWDAIGPSSLVVRLVFGETAFCFQGDIEEPQERALASGARQVACDTYLAGHHGSRHAGTSAWLARMDPEIAVVSFGENTFGHPTAEALCRIQQAGAQAYVTRGAAIIVASDGKQATVQRGEPERRDYCADGADYWS